MQKKYKTLFEIFADNPWLKWFFGIVFLIIGSILIFPKVFTPPFIIGSLIIIGGLIVLPPTFKKIEQKVGKQIPEHFQVYVFIGTAIISLFFFLNNRNQEKNQTKNASTETELNLPILTDSNAVQHTAKSAHSQAHSNTQDIIVYDAETGERKQIETKNNQTASSIVVTSLIVKKLPGKFRYFFDVRNEGEEPFTGDVKITLLSQNNGSNPPETFENNSSIQPNLGQQVFIDRNLGTPQFHGEVGIDHYKYEIIMNDRVIETGEGKLSSNFENLDN
jgi:hypothetical protein